MNYTQNKWFYHIAAKNNNLGRYRSILIKLTQPAKLLSQNLAPGLTTRCRTIPTHPTTALLLNFK